MKTDAASSPNPNQESRVHRETAPGPPPGPQNHALFLDVDGTLVEIASEPDRVRVTAPLRDLLQQLLVRLHGAVALISGRSLDDIDRLFAPLVLPAAGVHGLERRSGSGELHHAAAPASLADLRRPLQAFAARHDGVLLEDKGRALALHYRGAPHHRQGAEALVQRLLSEASAPLHLTRGKMVLELRPGSADKGTAIQDFMAEAPFAGRIPVFIGDDVTDEDGFRSVNRLQGLSIRVGRPAEETAAAFGLPDEDAVLAWLQDWLARTKDEGGMQGEGRP